MSKIIEEACKMLDPMDTVQKSYRVGYGRTRGFIILTNKKIMIMEEKGVFRRRYNVVLEIPYNWVKEVAVEDTHRLVVTDSEGKKHVFVSFAEVTASVLEGDLKGLIRAIFPRFLLSPQAADDEIARAKG